MSRYYAEHIRRGQIFKQRPLHLSNLMVLITPCCVRRLRIFASEFPVHRRTTTYHRRCPHCCRIWKITLIPVRGRKTWKVRLTA